MDQEQRKTFDNTSSSYLSLKAELLRKKQDIQRASSSSISSSAILDNLQSTSSSLKLKTKGELDVEVANPSKKKKKNIDLPTPSTTPSSNISREDEIAFAKSRAILEAKSKLYDEIMSNSEMKLLAEDDGNDDDDKSFLVDFERKIYETNQTDNHNQIEYTDSFGRTRLVTPDEYERFKASEKKQAPVQKSSNATEDEISRVERLHREQMRSKWESDMEALRNKNEVHYEDVLFDEKREHGVGYYQFSTDDKRRAEQMATLNELRTNTKTEQWKFSQEKEKRQSNIAERLNKMRLRKAKEMGIDLSGDNLKDKNALAIVSSDQSQIKEVSSSTNNAKEETLEQTLVDKTDEKQKELKLPSQLSEQKVPTTRTQQPLPLQTTTQHLNPSLAYPFPVIRAGNISASSTRTDPS